MSELHKRVHRMGWVPLLLLVLGCREEAQLERASSNSPLSGVTVIPVTTVVADQYFYCWASGYNFITSLGGVAPPAVPGTPGIYSRGGNIVYQLGAHGAGTVVVSVSVLESNAGGSVTLLVNGTSVQSTAISIGQVGWVSLPSNAVAASDSLQVRIVANNVSASEYGLRVNDVAAVLSGAAPGADGGVASDAGFYPFQYPIFSPDSFWTAPATSETLLFPDDGGIDPYVQGILEQSCVYGTTLPGPGAWSCPPPGLNTTEYTPRIYVVPSDFPEVTVIVDQHPTGSLSLDLIWNTDAGAGTGVPIPADAQPAEGTDREMVIYQPDYDDHTDAGLGRIFELWRTFTPDEALPLPDGGWGPPDGHWHASWGGRMMYVNRSPGHFVERNFNADLVCTNTENCEFNTWGTTATHLPFLGGIVTLSELAAGRIHHAVAFAPNYNAPWPNFVWPAQSTDGWCPTNGILSSMCVPEGTRFRLRPDFVIHPTWPTVVRLLCQAAQDYGLVIVDTSGGTAIRFENPKPSDLINGADPYTGTMVAVDGGMVQVIPPAQTLFEGIPAWELAQEFWDDCGPGLQTLSAPPSGP